MTRFIKSAVGQLLALNVLMFVLVRLLGQIDWLGMRWPWPWAWTPLTYMFTQAGVPELLINLICIWCFSQIFLMVGSEKRLVAAYICGGFGGSIFFALGGCMGIVSPGFTLLGASAAITGLAVAAGTLVPSYGVNLLLIGRVELKVIAWITVAFGLLAFLQGNPGGGMAHLGGAAGGVLAALAMRRGWLPRFSRRSIRRRTDAMTLDDLLDKVKKSGYESLSKAEKRRLVELSNNL